MFIELWNSNNNMAFHLNWRSVNLRKLPLSILGVVVSHDSIKMDPAKVARVAGWPTPSSKKEVQSFLGFTNFYWRFKESFSHIA